MIKVACVGLPVKVEQITEEMWIFCLKSWFWCVACIHWVFFFLPKQKQTKHPNQIPCGIHWKVVCQLFFEECQVCAQCASIYWITFFIWVIYFWSNCRRLQFSWKSKCQQLLITQILNTSMSFLGASAHFFVFFLYPFSFSELQQKKKHCVL